MVASPLQENVIALALPAEALKELGVLARVNLPVLAVEVALVQLLVESEDQMRLVAMALA